MTAKTVLKVYPSGGVPQFRLSARHDVLFGRIRDEARIMIEADPQLHALGFRQVLDHISFEAAISHRLASALAGFEISEIALVDIVRRVLAEHARITEAMARDLAAVVERDPAAGRVVEPFLFFKGYAAIQVHRIAHQLWLDGRRDLALLMQSRSSQNLQTDIHPAARFGTGIFLDHATGFVAGETVEVGDDVSILQAVTLGGSGIGDGRRHPRVGRGVMLGAGAKVLGPIDIGDHSRIAAGSVVTRSVPAHHTAVGVPARVIPHADALEPSRSMDQTLSDAEYESFTYTI